MSCVSLFQIFFFLCFWSHHQAQIFVVPKFHPSSCWKCRHVSISCLLTVKWLICIVCLFWARCWAGSWVWALNETQSLPEQRLFPMGRVTCVMRRLQQLRSKLPQEHTCIHTEGASLAGVAGSVYTRLVLARSLNSSQALNTYSGLQAPLCLLFLFSHGRALFIQENTEAT